MLRGAWPRPTNQAARLFVLLPLCLAAAGCSIGGEVLVRVADLPDTDAYRIEVDGRAMLADVGYLYSRTKALGLTVYTGRGRWVLWLDDERYVDRNRSIIDSVSSTAGFTLPDKPDLPLADRMANYVTLPLFVLVVLAGLIMRARGRSATPNGLAAPPPGGGAT